MYAVLVILLVCFMAGLVYGFQKGGYLALFAGIFIIAGASLLGAASRQIPGILTILGGACVFGAGTLLMAKGMVSSKWSDTGAFEAMAVSGFAAWIFFCTCLGAGRFAANKDRAVGFIAVFVPLIIVASISVPMIFGNRMQEYPFASAAETCYMLPGANITGSGWTMTSSDNGRGTPLTFKRIS